ncbi:MAG: hypothetical protein ABIV21_05100 [Pyrinomonadaceae bacterium]
MNDRRTGTIHGVLVNIGGNGVLLTGPAGIGKSACALELVSRGHRLVSDDVVLVTRKGQKLIGSAPGDLAGKLAVRGLGILDVRKLFGDKASEVNAALDLCIDLRESGVIEPPDPIVPWAQDLELLGVKVRSLVLPAGGGGHLATLVETAASLVQNGAEPTKIAAA